VTKGVGSGLPRVAAWVCGCPTEGNYVVAAAPKKGRRPVKWRWLWRAAARRGAATPRVSAAEKNSCSDYHISGEGLPRNWMHVLMCGGVHI
jgi:hypothetical protein